jgi:hypothetical protein
MKEVEETLEALEALEEVDEAVGGELLVVLGGVLDTDLEVLAGVGLQLGLQTVLHRQGPEEVDQPVGVEEVGVEHGLRDVVQVGVVLEGALQQAGLLAEGGDVCAVVVRKHLVTHDRVSHLARGYEKRKKKKKEKKINKEKDEKQEEMAVTCGAAMRFISSSLVCSGPSAGRLFFRASSRKAVHCCTCSVQRCNAFPCSAS